MMTVGNSSDEQILVELKEQYYSLLEEKFVLISRLKTEKLYVLQRISLRMQLANLHHHLIRTDNLRQCIMFGGEYEIPTDSAMSLRKEIEEELMAGFEKSTERLHNKIEILTARLNRAVEDNMRYGSALGKANKKLRENGINCAYGKKIEPAISIFDNPENEFMP
jgi:hypothetical protein